MKALYIILGNLALPFLIFYLRNSIYKAYYVFKLKDKKKKVPALDVKKFITLLSYGIILLGAFMFYQRINVEQQDRGDYNQVKKYNFR